MSLRRKNSSSFSDVKSVKRIISDAIDVKSVKRYNDNSWIEVWPDEITVPGEGYNLVKYCKDCRIKVQTGVQSEKWNEYDYYDVQKGYVPEYDYPIIPILRSYSRGYPSGNFNFKYTRFEFYENMDPNAFPAGMYLTIKGVWVTNTTSGSYSINPYYTFHAQAPIHLSSNSLMDNNIFYNTSKSKNSGFMFIFYFGDTDFDTADPGARVSQQGYIYEVTMHLS